MAQLTLEQLPINELAELGITQERLEKTNNLEKLLNFDKSSLLPLKFTFKEERIAADGKISLRKGADGNYHVMLHLIKQYPDLNAPIYGTYLNQTQKENLKLKGHAGSPIIIKKKDNTELQMLVSLDKETNQIYAFDKSRVKISNSILGVNLSENQITSLQNGEITLVENMKKKDGTTFSCDVVYDANKKSLSFITLPKTTETKKKEIKKESKKSQNIKL